MDENNGVIELIENEIYRIETQIRIKKPVNATIDEKQLDKVKRIVDFFATMKYAGNQDDMTIECRDCNFFHGAAVIGISSGMFDILEAIEMAEFARMIKEDTEIFSVEPIDEESIAFELQVSDVYV